MWNVMTFSPAWVLTYEDMNYFVANVWFGPTVPNSEINDVFEPFEKYPEWYIGFKIPLQQFSRPFALVLCIFACESIKRNENVKHFSKNVCVYYIIIKWMHDSVQCIRFIKFNTNAFRIVEQSALFCSWNTIFFSYSIRWYQHIVLSSVKLHAYTFQPEHNGNNNFPCHWHSGNF